MLNEYLNNNKSMRAISAEFGIAEYTIKKILTQNNITIRRSIYTHDKTFFNEMNVEWMNMFSGFYEEHGCSMQRGVVKFSFNGLELK